MVTNTAPSGAYRGAGRPEAIYTIERLMDAAARATGLDPAEIRRRNLVPADHMPYTNAMGQTYDSGRFEQVLDAGLDLADWVGFANFERLLSDGSFRISVINTLYYSVLHIPLTIIVSLGLALLATCAVALAENGRIPADNPATHLELTMVHEAMILEYSGRHLALIEYAAALRLLLWLTLIAAVFLPFGLAPAGAGPLAWAAGLLAWAAKIAGLAGAMTVLEASVAKMRVFRLPEFLGAALLLALLASVLLFVSQGFA